MARVYNFAAGPATLPLEVLEEAQKELLDYENSGMSVMEMSHRSKLYQQILAQAEQDLRTILSIPNNYQVDIGLKKLMKKEKNMEIVKSLPRVKMLVLCVFLIFLH